MSVTRGWAFQQALFTKLETTLAGAAPDGTDIRVVDHVLLDAPRVHCRIDGSNVLQRPIKADKTQHFFTVNLFDKPTTETSASRGQKVVKELQETVVGALHGWDPSVTGVTKLRHETSEVVPDDDGLTQHAMSRFSFHAS